MSRLLTSAAVFALLAPAAFAADIPVYEAPPPLVSPTPIAYNWSGFYIGAHGGFGWGSGAFDDGPVIGGQIGMNWQWNNFVLGAEGDGSWVDFGGADAIGSARLRAGFAFDRVMVYGTGGAAFDDFSDVGWVAGGGAEFALTPNWILGAEYLHYDFGSDEADVIRGRVSYLFGAF
ncbi:MAG TPA: outer membrane beta-barrel protein [Propylenella sp.]